MKHKSVVCAILVGVDGRVLLQQRDEKPGLVYAGYWTIFGGQVEAGETPDEAIQRELREELDITLPLRLWSEYICPVRTRPGELTVTNHVYVGEMPYDINTLTLYEGQAMRYFSAEDSADLLLAFDQHIPLRAYFQGRKR
ncbi:MAG: NUDIX domain-containing protein [bacterium]|nr:NUDIX domain-containing protein [bacterium]